MSRRLPPDPELEDLFARDPSLEPYANLLRTSRLKEPPLDPAFRSALRRQILEEAWRRTERRSSLLASLFRGPGLAWAGASMAAVLLAIVVVQLSGQGTPVTQVSYLSSYPTGSVNADQPITLTFSQPMDHQTVEQAIHIEPATEVKFSWQGNQLTIVPAASSLAPNTQYHVTIAPTATTATGKPIDKPIAVTFNTQTPPSPAPTPNAGRSPGIGLAGERLLEPGAVSIVGWSADGATIFYIGRSGDLGSVGADGQQRQTIVRDGVRRAALSPSGMQLAYIRAGSVAVVGTDGSGLQVLAQVDPIDLGWSGARIVYAIASEVLPTPPTALPTASPAASPSPSPSSRPTPVPAVSPSPAPSSSPSSSPAPGAQALTVQAQASNLSFAPDGKHLVYSLGSATVVSDGTTVITWAQPAGSAVAWSPDSASVAFTADGALFTAAPDGSRRLQLTTLGMLALGGPEIPTVSWSSTDQLLLGTSKVLSTIRADGSNGGDVRDVEYSHPLWAPAATRFAFMRGGDLWVANLSSTGGGSSALDDAGKVVDSFMQARLAGDSAKASSLLDSDGRQAYAGDGPPLVITTDPRPRRYYVISAQLLPGADAGVQYVVRLVLARGSTEVFAYDETLTLQRRSSGTLMIHAAKAGPRTPLGNGPSVVSAAVRGRQVVIAFDSDLAPETIASAVKVTDPTGRTVTVKADYANRVLTVTLPELPPVTGYRLALATSLQDIDHQPLTSEFDFDFVAAAVMASPSPQVP